MYKILLSLSALLITNALANDNIYRCGSEYTNDTNKAKALNCTKLEINNVTVIHGTKVHKNLPNINHQQTTTSYKNNNNMNVHVTSNKQKKLDKQAKFILETELKQQQNNLKQQIKAFNNGQPLELAQEKNQQIYQAKVLEMQKDIQRTKEDIYAIEHELAKLK